MTMYTQNDIMYMSEKWTWVKGEQVKYSGKRTGEAKNQSLVSPTPNVRFTESRIVYRCRFFFTSNQLFKNFNSLHHFPSNRKANLHQISFVARSHTPKRPFQIFITFVLQGRCDCLCVFLRVITQSDRRSL